MNWSIIHELLLELIKIARIDCIGICESDLFYFLVESACKLSLNGCEATTTCWVRDNKQALETRWLNIVFPDMFGMWLHSIVVWDALTTNFIHVWIHHNNWVVVHLGPLDLWKEATEFKVILADRSSPNASSHISCSLDKNKSSLLFIQKLLWLRWFVEFTTHKNIALGSAICLDNFLQWFWFGFLFDAVEDMVLRHRDFL